MYYRHTFLRLQVFQSSVESFGARQGGTAIGAINEINVSTRCFSTPGIMSFLNTEGDETLGITRASHF